MTKKKKTKASAPDEKTPAAAVSPTGPPKPPPAAGQPEVTAAAADAPPPAESAPLPAPAGDKIEVVPLASDEYDELQKAFSALEHDFLRLKQENDELKDKYLRKLAEMDNLRKRVEREKAEFQSFALNAVLRDILVVADSFGRALSGPADLDGTSFRDGVDLIFKQLMDVLAKYGVTPIDAVGRVFDPTLHQAFASEETEEIAEPTVVEEMQKGYLLHGRLLRPALVKVHVPKKDG